MRHTFLTNEHLKPNTMKITPEKDAVDNLVALLSQALRCHSPSGAEAEADTFLRDQLSALGCEPKQDAAGNLFVELHGESSDRRIIVAAHKDELGMLVRAVDDQGVIFPERLNGGTAWVYGEGPVEILGRNKTVIGILGFGSRHVTPPSPFHRLQTDKVVDWSDARIETKLTSKALAEAGVGIGSRIVVARSRKGPILLPDDFVAAYALDNRAAMAALLLLIGKLRRPRYDTWLAFPANEEIGAVGAAYFASQIRPTDVIALEILPLSDQCAAPDLHMPYLLARDRYCIYDEALNNQIRDAAESVGDSVGMSTLPAFGSDASISKKYGHAPQAACLCLPTLNSHGFEITSVRSMLGMVYVLAAFLDTSFQRQG